jgi:biopolymer transport protein ExbB
MNLMRPLQLRSVQTALRSLACALVLIGNLALVSPIHAQEVDANGLKPGESKTLTHSKTMMDIWHEGGWVMYPLALCSVALVWLSTDMWMRTGVKKMAPESHVAQMQDLFRAGDYVGAYQFAKGNPTTFTDTSRIALSFLGDGQETTEFAIFDGLNKANASLQTRINYLSVIGVCTPMIGLTGTVTGMMKAFEKLGGGGGTDPSQLAGAIGEVLIATAAGLFIAIPAFMLFYVLRNRLQATMHDVQEMLTALFRKMPYSHLKDCHVGEEEFFAAMPNWVAGGGTEAAAH